MNDNELNGWIERYKDQPVPASPSNLESNVLRRIRLSATESGQDIWSLLGTYFPKTGLIAIASALVITTSSLVSFASVAAHAESAERRMETHSFLDLSFVMSTELIDLAKH